MNNAGYHLPDNYVARDEPRYFDDPTASKVVWQPHVYELAEELTGALGAPAVIDIGCGNGAKIAAMGISARKVGLDFGANAEIAGGRQGVEILRHDLDADAPLPLDRSTLEGSVVICADVIEHLRHPERLVRALAAAMADGAACIVVSTPDRTLLYPKEQLGPPSNPAHVREWTREELGVFLTAEGLSWRWCVPTLTNTARPDYFTSMVVACKEDLAASVAPLVKTPPGNLTSFRTRLSRYPVLEPAHRWRRSRLTA